MVSGTGELRPGSIPGDGRGDDMKRIGAGIIALALAAGLAGCSTSTGAGGVVDAPRAGDGSPSASPSPAPTSSADADDQGGDVEAAWLDDGRAIGLVTSGSSSCPPIAQDAEYADGVLTVQLDDREDEACTRDLVPRGTYVGLPEGVDPAADLEIVVTGTYADDLDLDGDASLEGMPGSETSYEPTAGWADDDLLLLLTWGSSGCVPVIESAEASGGTVTVAVQDPPADQVCTMDMAPRVTVISVDDADDASELVLTGAEFDAQVRIAGSD
jgi:predicted small secreted protein